jgi:hypothetical protein
VQGRPSRRRTAAVGGLLYACRGHFGKTIDLVGSSAFLLQSCTLGKVVTREQSLPGDSVVSDWLLRSVELPAFGGGPKQGVREQWVAC